MEHENIVLQESGLRCDNPNCDWEDKSITFANYTDWINRPCPKCGDNLLTFEDYKNAEVLRLAAKFMNQMTPDELIEFSKSFNVASIKDNQIFSDVKGLEFLNGDGLVNVSIDTHKEIKIKEITPVD